ncbi:MAG TPA: UDP-N-acetylglucosamine 1-carboxyvinyltransferase [Candidatus Omnitrophica bacterium]|nr:UDP-N-acetylglucosamine 1-carboxyvinyltransferase [Candidatus Omnitrophota bacterium]
MEKIIIEGGERLKGEVRISGAKNSALPLMASALLAEGVCTIKNVPKLRDVNTFVDLLKYIGVKVSRDKEEELEFDATSINCYEAPYNHVKTMRASVLVLGPLIARFGKAKVSLPGGCAIGARPINLHLKGLEALGAKVSIEHGYVIAKARRLKGGNIYFDIPTVTGTENLMMAASLASGNTIIENAACEPEVSELAHVLRKMGAKISGDGTERIEIEGVDKLNPFEHIIMPDRIETGTFMLAAGITRGNITISNCVPAHSQTLILKLRETGIEVIEGDSWVRVISPEEIRATDVKTSPYPGFPTDMQAQFMALMCLSKGLSVITENVFENRFMHVSELLRMGTDIKIDGRSAIVRGVPFLSGAPVMATDLRASASLILAGLAARGETTVSRIYHIDRGYERIEEKLQKLGAKIKRVK